MKSPSPRLALIFTCAAFSLTGCIKTPLRTTLPSGTAGHRFPGSGDPTIAKSDITDLIARNELGDRTRHDRTLLQEHVIFFDTDTSDLRPSERDKLSLVKAYLDTHPGEKLVLEGHCDWRGTAEYNLSLGDRRANATKHYLQSIGVPPQRLDTLSKGSIEAPKEAEPGAMKKDRRVEFVVVN